MAKMQKETIEAKGLSIQVYTEDFQNDYISLTDIARYKNPEEPNVVVANWMRNYNTIEYLGIWEQLNNLDFNPLEFEGFKKEAGANAFTLSPKKWIESTNAIGLVAKSGAGPQSLSLEKINHGGIKYLDSLGMGLEIKAYSKDKTANEPVEAILLKV